MFGKLVQKIFYGPLRATEVEHLYEKAWYAITETCLAMTIFRDEFDGRFIVMFTVLLFLKCFHWLGADRVDFVSSALSSGTMGSRISRVICVLIHGVDGTNAASSTGNLPYPTIYFLGFTPRNGLPPYSLLHHHSDDSRKAQYAGHVCV